MPSLRQVMYLIQTWRSNRSVSFIIFVFYNSYSYDNYISDNSHWYLLADMYWHTEWAARYKALHEIESRYQCIISVLKIDIYDNFTYPINNHHNTYYCDIAFCRVCCCVLLDGIFKFVISLKRGKWCDAHVMHMLPRRKINKKNCGSCNLALIWP